MSRPDSFTLPPQLEHYRGDITAAHAQLRAQSLDSICKAVPPTQWVDKTAYIRYTPENSADKVDPEHAIVVPFTFGNGNGANQLYRMHLLLNSIPGADKSPQQIIGFPMPGSRAPKQIPKKPRFPHIERPFQLNGDEREVVRSGDFTPITDQQRLVLWELGISNVEVIGYSCGAAIAASLVAGAAEAGLNVGKVGLFEPPNMRADKMRTPLKLKVAHALAGLDFIRCVKESDLPGFTRLQQARWRDIPGQVRDSIASRFGDRRIPEQKALEVGLAKQRFQQDVQAFMEAKANAEAAVLVVRGQYSDVASRTGFHALKQMPCYKTGENGQPSRVRLAEIAGYGHGMGNNLPLFTALTLAALRAEPIPPAA